MQLHTYFSAIRRVWFSFFCFRFYCKINIKLTFYVYEQKSYRGCWNGKFIMNQWIAFFFSLKQNFFFLCLVTSTLNFHWNLHEWFGILNEMFAFKTTIFTFTKSKLKFKETEWFVYREGKAEHEHTFSKLKFVLQFASYYESQYQCVL